MYRIRPIKTVSLFLWAFFLAYLSANSSCLADSRQQEFSQLIEHGGFIVTSATRSLASQHSAVSFIPASTIKIATALLAIDSLGPDFRFKTEFYLRQEQTLVIKGYGDPFLVSEMIPTIAKGLEHAGITSIQRLVLDQNYFSGSLLPDGSENSVNPYDVSNAALAVNFNTLPVIKYDTGRIESAEPQTPLLPIMLDIGRQLNPGRHRVNVNAFPTRFGTTNTDRYGAELFISLLRAAGIDMAPSFTTGIVQDSDRLVYTYYSEKTLSELIRSSLKYSSNFMANQLYLASGAEKLGPPADWQKSNQSMAEFLLECCAIDAVQMTLIEGSGLSRQNRATPEAMLQLLRAFTPHATLIQEKDGMLLKSGSLQDVHNYVGYLVGPTSLDPFVIYLNQPGNTRREVLQILRQIHHSSQPNGTEPVSP